MKTSHVVIILVVLFAAVLGAAIYWVRTYHSFWNYSGLPQATFTINIDSDTKWSGTIDGASRSGEGPASFTVNSATTSAGIQKLTDSGYLTVTILKDGAIAASQTTTDAFGVVAVSS